MRVGKVAGGTVLLLLAVCFVYALSTHERAATPYIPIPNAPKGNMNITSESFGDQATIPVRFTCDGQDVHPELSFHKVPDTAKSLALVVDDPDAPGGTFLHWTVWNIPAETKVIAEGIAPQGAREGDTSFGKSGYGGPCPPSGTHRYFFKLYALDTVLDVPTGASLRELEQAMIGHIVGQAELMGTYARQ